MPEKAVAAIKTRGARWQTGDRSPDGRKIGLVIEGGGMRGVCSGGGAVALASMGFTDLFDGVYATSAGVMNASYFLSNQPELGISVYYDCLASRKFINPFRPWKILDVDYVFNHVVTVAKPLDVQSILASRTNFYVALMDKRQGKGFMIDVKKTRAPLLNVLKAATAIPVLYNRTVHVDGIACMDAGLSIPFPIEQAIADGCTDLLVLLTRPPTFVCLAPNWISRMLFKLICGLNNAELCRIFAEHGSKETFLRNLALGKTPPTQKVNIATVCTDSTEEALRTSMDRGKLRASAVRYGRKVFKIFGRARDDWDLPPLTAI